MTTDTPDAYQQLIAIQQKFIKNWKTRPDLEVTALAHERGIKVYTTDRRHNVSTMREFAQSILEACDFVEESNPDWAKVAAKTRGQKIVVQR